METIGIEKRVTLRYVMKSHLPDGTVKEHPEARMSFIFGVDRQVQTLEKVLEGSQEGERKSLTIPASEIYGEHDPTLIREIPKKGLVKQRLKVGQLYRQMKGGTLISFKVLEIRPHSVLADFNRPMAGIEVTMDLEVLKVREAGRSEIDAAMDAQIKRSIGCG
jgi:FKBP-type peptidyl-prolyl cis-trans isomerase SlyD